MKLKITLSLLACALFLSQNLLAQLPTIYDVVPGSTDSYAYDKIEIGNRLYFTYEEPISDEEFIAYLSVDGKIRFPIYNVADSLEVRNVNSEIIDLNSSPYWIQEFYDLNNGDYIYSLCHLVNDTVQLVMQPDFQPYELVTYNNDIYMNGYNDTTGTAIFKYDGTAISVDHDILPSGFVGYSYSLNLLNSKLYYYVYNNDLGNHFIVEFDGTNHLYDTLNTNSYGPLGFMVNKNDSIFFGSQGPSGITLNRWFSGAIQSTSFPHYIYDAEIIGDEMYYCTYNVQNIMKRNLTTGNIISIPGAIPYNTYEFTMFENKIFFQTNLDNSNNYSELCYVDPAADTALYITLPNQSNWINDLTVVDTELYFTTAVNDPIMGATGIELFRYNNGNPVMVAEINTTMAENGNSYPYEFVTYQGMMAMTAYTPQAGEELVIICTNGTLPTVPVSQIVCENSMVSDIAANGQNLVWHDAATLGNEINNTQLVTQSGTYYVSTTFVCPGDRVAVPFTVSMLPENVAAYYGDSIVKVVNPTAAYQWMDCTTGTPINGATSQSYQATMNGTYQCLLTNADGCSTTTNCVYLVNLSVDENLKNTVKLYPNPASDYIQLRSDEQMDRVTVTSLSGQIIREEQIASMSYTMDVNQFTNGIYLMLIYDNNNVLISKQKIVVNK